MALEAHGLSVLARPTGSSHRNVIYQDALYAPLHMVAELSAGRLHIEKRLAVRHAMANSILGGELVAPFRRGRGGPGGCWIVDAPELHLGR